MPETIIDLPNGWSLRSEAGDNVRLVRPDGSEHVYWDQNEWHEDPVGVMAAIFGAATTLPADNTDSVKLDRHEREARAFAAFVDAQGHSLAEILGREGPEDLVLTRDRFSPETLAELAIIAFPDDDDPQPDPALVELFNRPSRLSNSRRPAVVIITEGETDIWNSDDVDVFVYPVHESPDDMRRDADMLRDRGLPDAARAVHELADSRESQSD